MQVSEREVHNDTTYWLKRASHSRECLFVTDGGEPQAVIIGMDAFRALVGWQTMSMQPSMSSEELGQHFSRALQDAGYHTEDDITNLVRDVKREIAAERATASSTTSVTPPQSETDESWEEFLQGTYGMFRDEPLVRGSQGALEIREALE